MWLHWENSIQWHHDPVKELLSQNEREGSKEKMEAHLPIPVE